MLTLHVRYLMGRVYASDFDDGDLKERVEWPPHPSRLFSALVAAWAEGGSEEELRPALEWLEAQPPPAIHAAECDERRLVQHYVPVNDAGHVDEDRSRKPRQFPSAWLQDPHVYFVWDTEVPEQVWDTLPVLLGRTSSLGHSASLVAMECSAAPPGQRLPRWVPGAPESIQRLRVPDAGRLVELEQAYARFLAEPAKVHRPPTGASVLYGQERRPGPRQGVFGEMVPLRRRSGTPVPLEASLGLLRSFRRALLSRAGEKLAEIPPFLSGHSAAGQTALPACGPHVALVPLAFTGRQYATGAVLGVAALLPAELSRQERQLCRRILQNIDHLHGSWGEWKIEAAGEDARETLEPGTWMAPSHCWSTVTPLVFDRFPKDPTGEEAMSIVRRAFDRIGLPEPVEVRISATAWFTGVPAAGNFPAAPAQPGKPKRYHRHVFVRFAERVRGPIAAGAGRFYGYGFFRPHQEVIR